MPIYEIEVNLECNVKVEADDLEEAQEIAIEGFSVHHADAEETVDWSPDVVGALDANGERLLPKVRK